MVALEPGGSTPSGGAQALSRGVPLRSTSVTGSPSSRQTEATSEPIKPPPMMRTRSGPAARRSRRRAASSRVRTVKTPSRAASSAFGHCRARVPVAISTRSNSTSLPSPSWTRRPARSNATAETPRRHSASMSTNWGKVVCSTGSHPVRTVFERGGRSYGG